MDRVKYPELDRHEQLRNGGREILGKYVHWTEKRDGTNLAVWRQGEEIIISSRNQDVAADIFTNGLKSTKEWVKISTLLHDFPSFTLFGEYVTAGYGPTRIEPKHKYPSFTLFDIYDPHFCPSHIEGEYHGRFLAYTAFYQHAYHYRIPVVRSISQGVYNTMEELEKEVLRMKAWARRHRREGVVGKAFDGLTALYWKEKVDTPKLVKIPKANPQGVVLPPLPDSEINGAIMKVITDIGVEDFRDKGKAMPLVAQYINEEAKKHLFAPPRDMYPRYLEFLSRIDREEIVF